MCRYAATLQYSNKVASQNSDRVLSNLNACKLQQTHPAHPPSFPPLLTLRVVVIRHPARALHTAARPGPSQPTALPPQLRTAAPRGLGASRRRRHNRSPTARHRARLQEVDQLGPDLLRNELVALAVGVHAVALQHGVGEAVGPRAVGDDDGRLRRGVG